MSLLCSRLVSSTCQFLIIKVHFQPLKCITVLRYQLHHGHKSTLIIFYSSFKLQLVRRVKASLSNLHSPSKSTEFQLVELTPRIQKKKKICTQKMMTSTLSRLRQSLLNIRTLLQQSLHFPIPIAAVHSSVLPFLAFHFFFLSLSLSAAPHSKFPLSSQTSSFN